MQQLKTNDLWSNQMFRLLMCSAILVFFHSVIFAQNADSELKNNQLDFTIPFDINNPLTNTKQWNLGMTSNFINTNSSDFSIWLNLFGPTIDAPPIPAIYLREGNTTYGVDVGLGTIEPKTRLHLGSGNIYLQQRNASVILTSPGGLCFSISVDDSGQLSSTAVVCPN